MNTVNERYWFQRGNKTNMSSLTFDFPENVKSAGSPRVRALPFPFLVILRS